MKNSIYMISHMMLTSNQCNPFPFTCIHIVLTRPGGFSAWKSSTSLIPPFLCFLIGS